MINFVAWILITSVLSFDDISYNMFAYNTIYGVIFIGTDKDKPVPMEVECYEQANDESIDFTADISLDQLDTQKEVTDEDVMHHLDVIENIDLDPETFCINKSIENDESENFKSDEEDLMQDDEVTIIEEVMGEVEEEWYKEKVILYMIFLLH